MPADYPTGNRRNPPRVAPPATRPVTPRPVARRPWIRLSKIAPSPSPGLEVQSGGPSAVTFGKPTTYRYVFRLADPRVHEGRIRRTERSEDLVVCL
ncbi:hypothetical protein GCM10022236_49490 [Microlunatus ginsengisoli]|uniref:Uncharacterized protein n=1 Tax=Microlunatus ginsengisoli TaxID=363863 RepID=A0ABP7AUN5_9ACTN